MAYRRGGMSGRFAFKHCLLMSLLGLALLTRALVPAGWMPTGKQAFAVTVCTGMDTQTVWIDRDGTIHKSDPSKKPHDGDGKQDCAFAGLGTPGVAADAADFSAVAQAESTELPLPVAAVAIGRGLAAPPPPSTGPPLLT